MKALLRFLFMLILVSYLLVSFFYLRSYAGGEVCKGLEINVLDSMTTHYFTPDDVMGYLDDPDGISVSEVHLGDMEKALLKDGNLASAECYKLINGTVRVEVTQRTPVMRVLGEGEGFYVDQEGNRLSECPQYKLNLPLLTGCVDSILTYRDVLPLAQYIGNDDFWNAQIEQIYVNDRHEIELFPRVGSRVVLLGSIEEYETKMDNLMQIYKQVFHYREGIAYDTISLKYRGQVVCSYSK